MMRKESRAGIISATLQQRPIHKSSNLFDPVDTTTTIFYAHYGMPVAMPWPVTRFCAFYTHQQLCKLPFLIENSLGEVKCLADIPLLHLGGKVAAFYGSYWIIKVAHLQFSPLAEGARES